MPHGAYCATKNNYYLPSFKGANFLLRKGNGIEQEKLNKEEQQAQIARANGVIVPKYRTKHDEAQNVTQIRYQTEGDIADIKTNPLRTKHFGSLFKNLYYMDAAGIFHNDLDPSHIFLGKDGKVEIDCFRYSVNFYKRLSGVISGNDGSIRTPEFMYPSNEKIFEEHFLGGYISPMDEDDKTYFVKNYLRERANYHLKRENMLLKRGFAQNSKTVQYEALQSDLFSNPSHRVVNYEISKLEVLKLKRDAFTEWDEGGGACGHDVDPQRCFVAILMNIDCIMETMQIKNLAEYYSKEVKDVKERTYFAFEQELAQKQIEDLIDDTKGMGGWTFNDTKNKIFIGDKDEKQFFEGLFGEIDLSDYQKTIKALLDIKEYYASLKDRWNGNLNNVLAQDY